MKWWPFTTPIYKFDSLHDQWKGCLRCSSKNTDHDYAYGGIEQFPLCQLCWDELHPHQRFKYLVLQVACWLEISTNYNWWDSKEAYNRYVQDMLKKLEHARRAIFIDGWKDYAGYHVMTPQFGPTTRWYTNCYRDDNHHDFVYIPKLDLNLCQSCWRWYVPFIGPSEQYWSRQWVEPWEVQWKRSVENAKTPDPAGN